MIRSRLSILFLLVYLHSAGQRPIYSNSRWFKVEDGLPQSFISGIQQDKDGFLWVGTRDGLARYDGRGFSIFRQNKNDSLSLSSNTITDLVLDSQNLLWIFYVNEKFDCFDPRKLQVCYSDSFAMARKLLAEIKTKKFIRDHSGRFWFSSKSQGVVCYDPLNGKTIKFDSASQNLHGRHSLGLAESGNGNMWAFTENGIENLYYSGKRSSLYIPFPNSIHLNFNQSNTYLAISLNDGRMALAESNRLILFDPATKFFAEYSLPPGPGFIQQAVIGNDGLLYLVYAGGIYRFEKNNQFTWIWQSNSANPFANDCRSFLVDQSSVIWFGTNAGGIAKIDQQALPFTSNPYTINFTSDLLSGISRDIPPLLKTGKWAYFLRSCYDANKRLWISYQEREDTDLPLRIFVLDHNKFIQVSAPPGNYPMIKGLSLSPSGEMYACDLRGNTWKWKDISSSPVYSPSVLSLNSTSTVVDMEADENIFWIATDKEGLFKIQNNKVVDHFSTSKDKQWPGNQLTDLCKDPVDPDILWIGTLGNGLVQLKKSNGSFKIFTLENNLPNNTIYSIVPDQKGNLWISTNKGITRYSLSTGSFSNYDVKDGLIGNEFNRFHHLRLPDGQIAFGGPDGYTVFDPSTFKTDSFQTTVGFTGLMINNKPVKYENNRKTLTEPLNQLDELVLPYNENFLQFEFAGLQFNQPEKINYRYMLEGYDKEWISSSRNIASYTRLPTGYYTLLVNASNTSGAWSKFIKRLAIRIKPPFWATWWAYLIYTLLALWLIRTYWRYRLNRIRMQNQIALEHGKAQQLKELDELKDRFFSNITHELRTPLTLILSPLEKIIQHPVDAPTEKRILSNAHKNAEQLLRLINQLLDISKIEAGQMQVHETIGEPAAFVESCVQQFLTQANLAGIKLSFVNKSVSGLYLFDEDKWEKIIFNLLGNAIKFTPANGEVVVSLSCTEQSINRPVMKLEISDTGTGISKEDIPKLFDRFYMVDSSKTKEKGGSGIGLSLVRELVGLMKGTVEVDSELGKGSRFSVSIPVEKTSASIFPSAIEKIETGTGIKNQNEKQVVLVVEDNEELLAFLAESLADHWNVMTARNGKQGWDLVVSELPDFIISDLMMPEMDGFEFCSKVKEDPRSGHIGFILLSARAAHESKLAGFKKGADEYLTKPFHFDELEIRLQNLCEQQKRLRDHFRKEWLTTSPVNNLPHVSDEFLKNIYQKLDEKIDDPHLSVEAIASMVNMSQRTLNRKLKAIINLSPVEFVRHYRLQKAASLIAAGHGITDTAYSVGFETASYFTQCFKQQFGKTPTEWAAKKDVV